jgi:hypothetical protein
MIKSLTPAQARLIADTLTALETVGSSKRDGQYLRIQLFDDCYGFPIGDFTEEEGAWLFEMIGG